MTFETFNTHIITELVMLSLYDAAGANYLLVSSLKVSTEAEKADVDSLNA